MSPRHFRLRKFFRVGAAVHAVALTAEGCAWAGSERDLRLLDPRGHVRFRLGGAHAVRPFSALAADCAGRILAVERTGRLYRLDPLADEAGEPDNALPGAWTPDPIWAECNDLYSLAAQAGNGGNGESLVALGHVGPALTMLDATGRLRWRCHPEDATATGGRTWSVAFSADGASLYAGCLAPAQHARRASYLLAAFEAETGRVYAARNFAEPVSVLAALPAPLGVAVVHAARTGCRVVGYDADLREAVWRVACAPGEFVTALTSDPASSILVAGTNTGRLWLLDGLTGRRLAVHDLLYYSTVLSVAARNLGERETATGDTEIVLKAECASSDADGHSGAEGRAAPEHALLRTDENFVPSVADTSGAIVAGLANGHAAYLSHRGH